MQLLYISIYNNNKKTIKNNKKTIKKQYVIFTIYIRNLFLFYIIVFTSYFGKSIHNLREREQQIKYIKNIFLKEIFKILQK